MYEIEWDWFKNGEDGDFFWWTNGNFQCDCNRRMSFNRAGGMNEERVAEIEDEMDKRERGACSDGAYSALYAELTDGTKIPLDSE